MFIVVLIYVVDMWCLGSFAFPGNDMLTNHLPDALTENMKVKRYKAAGCTNESQNYHFSRWRLITWPVQCSEQNIYTITCIN